MPSNELICPKHGPYPASLGACPYCSNAGSRPKAPLPLDEDDETPTDLGNRPGAARQRPAPSLDVDDMPTDLPVSRKPGAGRRILDMDEEEETNLGRRGRAVDETEVAFAPSGAEAILWVKEGNRRGRIYKIKGDTVISRKEGDLILDDPKVSNPHAKITCEDGQYTIWDFASRNGTFVNGERIRAATPLKENDVIKLGELVFIIKILE